MEAVHCSGRPLFALGPTYVRKVCRPTYLYPLPWVRTETAFPLNLGISERAALLPSPKMAILPATIMEGRRCTQPQNFAILTREFIVCNPWSHFLPIVATFESKRSLLG